MKNDIQEIMEIYNQLPPDVQELADLFLDLLLIAQESGTDIPPVPAE